MSEMSRAEAVRQAWAAIRSARAAFDRGDLARVSVLMEVSAAWSRIAEVMGNIPPAELASVIAPVPQLRADETAIIPVQQQERRTTISVPLRHAFVPGRDDPLFGPDSSWCAHRLPDGDFCGALPLHAAHTVVRHAFVPGPDPTFCAHPISDRLNCALYAKHSVHDVAPVEPFAPGHMPREFP